ncbi:DUF4262 domain-containing protein [Mycobacterium sp. 1423905.2]|uniref:DUF4262 domain-containing protein n=1 Tax=Mycobacterium sp. 1423905.2 TaxID=1856859 RepID=UPI0007FEC340|nr:DUF4262 domain-containing protein [Mycobacterium sp. 1423905.2]OBJ50889.1 hypothetical protein A9W95_22905 [Mycobacterium sp. 1423905.2]
MCWQCDNPDATVEDYLDVVRAIIADRGWAVQYVEHESRPFAYTVGLSRRGLPELLITGMRPHMSARVLNSVAHQIVDDGMVLRPAERIDFQGEFLLEVVEVAHPDVHLKVVLGLYERPFRAFQLVWTDDCRHWPWDLGWSRGRRRQPVLGIRSELTK